jgi:hypothetical protein
MIGVSIKRKKVIGGLAMVLILAVVVINFSSRPRHMAVELSLVGYTNVNGTAMALFKIQNNQSRRIWIRHCDYLLGEAFQEPPGAWECSNEAAWASNRWSNSIMVPQQYLRRSPHRLVPIQLTLLFRYHRTSRCGGSE